MTTATAATTPPLPAHLPALPVVDIKETHLDNGVRVLTGAMPHHARCHVFVQVRGGPVHEDDETWGLSHVIEHMVFRGTKTHADAHAVGLAADDFGGDVGAATYRDRVTYDTRCDPDGVGAALSLLAEMLGSPRFEGLSTELGIIEEELAELYDDDGQEIDIDNASFRQLFADDVLSRTIEGTPKVLKKITPALVERFHKQWYRGGNIVVSVAGPVDHDAVVAVAKKAFGRLPEGASPPTGTPPKLHEPHTRDVVVIKTDDAQTEVRLTFVTPGFTDSNAVVAAMLGRVLDDGPASRLQQEVIDRDGLAYSAWAMADLYEHKGMLELAGAVRHDRVGKLVKAFAQQLQALATTPPTTAELARIVKRVWRDTRDLLDDPASVAEAIGKGALFGQPFSAALQVARFASVTPEQVQAAAAAAAQAPRLCLVG
ncbi:MAG TPA: pitrilysin family protein, partial [Myxococcota bacterium]